MSTSFREKFQMYRVGSSTIRVELRNPKKGSFFKHDNIENIYNELSKKVDKDKISVFGMAIDGGKSIKVVDENFKSFDKSTHYDDNDNVSNAEEKFNAYIFAEFTISDNDRVINKRKMKKNKKK